MGAGGQTIPLAPRRREVEEHPLYVGVRDARDPAPHDPSLAHEMRNVYPQDPFVGQGIVGRPGFVLTGAQVASAAVQGGHQFSKLDGTEITLVVVAGEIYQYDWALDSWSKKIATADLTGASITLATSGRVFLVTFADNVVISDGTNTPFMWDGTASGGLTSLTNAPVFYGQPVVYYAKLFGIKDSERSTIVWSEENQPNTGYEAGGFNNAWTLGQTETESLYALIPTNAALYYMRARSTGAITGQVTSNFQTTGTHEAVSQKVGTTSPGGWTRVNDLIFFTDADGRPQVLRVGGLVQQPEIWRPARDELATVRDTELASAQVVYQDDIGLVLHATVTAAATALDKTYNFNPQTGRFTGYFDGFEAATFFEAKDEEDQAVIMYGDESGYVFRHALNSEGVWSDEDSSGASVAIPHVVEGAPYGYSTREEKILDRVDVAFVVFNTTSVTLKVTTERGTQDSGLNWTGPTIGSAWDALIWDQEEWDGTDVDELRKTFGLDVYGRWFRLRLEHSEVNEQFGVMSMAAEYFYEGSDVRMP